LFGIDSSSGKGCALGGVGAGLFGQLKLRPPQAPRLRAKGGKAQCQGAGGCLEGEAANHGMG
jgi:hypothetical protein